MMAFSSVLFGTIGSTLTCLILLAFAVFLILLVLVQRGKGGGLSGAFGGMGGQSAFGTKAGDTFTRVTVVTATLWIVFCIISAKYLGVTSSRFTSAASSAATSATIPGGSESGAGPLGGNVDDLGGRTFGSGPADASSNESSAPADEGESDSSGVGDAAGEAESAAKTDEN